MLSLWLLDIQCNLSYIFNLIRILVKKRAKNKEVRTQVGKLRRILMWDNICKNRDNFVDFANFVLVWREIHVCPSQTHVKASRQLEPGPAHIKPGPGAEKRLGTNCTISFNFISCQCFVIDSKAPGAFTGLCMGGRPEWNTCPVVVWAWYFTMPIRQRGWWWGGGGVYKRQVNHYQWFLQGKPCSSRTTHQLPPSNC